MYFPLPTGAEDRIVRGVEQRMAAPFMPDKRPNPEYSPNRKMLLACRSLIRRAAKDFNRRVNWRVGRRHKSVAGLLKDPTVASELALQKVVNKMTNRQRNAWARAGYPGLKDVPRRPERAAPFLEA